ncbi:hypothetical protein J4558_12185 [Leptolyngbya sp. 15MV]|nr:hypothetical protein J4558_12185 [Leptolyngbya sp. 15MV]
MRPDTMRGVPSEPSTPHLAAPPLPYRILIGTFHKTGSVLMARLWRDGCKALGLRFWPMHAGNRAEPAAWDVCFEDHSRFPPEALAKPHRGALVIRDPRDIIISGAHYHTHSTEGWLHRPKPAFGGLTYQQKINSLPTPEARLLFEMRQVAARTFRDIDAAMRRHPDFHVARFEELVSDPAMRGYRAMFTALGFEGAAQEALRAAARRHSLFTGRVENPEHVRSGRPGEWRTGFSERVMRAFMEAHGDLPQRWGYPGPEGVALS